LKRNYVAYRYCVSQGVELTRDIDMPFLFLSYPFVLREGVKGIDISIGIGGSFLGPLFVHTALQTSFLMLY
jgi:hypothetical protein